jgi:hypothetical protein
VKSTCGRLLLLSGLLAILFFVYIYPVVAFWLQGKFKNWIAEIPCEVSLASGVVEIYFSILFFSFAVCEYGMVFFMALLPVRDTCFQHE